MVRRRIFAAFGIGLAGPDGVGDDQLAQHRLGDARRSARPTARRGCNRRRPRSRPAASAPRRRCTACPPKSTMSSIRMQVRPSTSPMMFITSDSPARSRRLSTIASGALLSRLASAAGAHHAADVGRDDQQIAVAEARAGCRPRSPARRTDCRSGCRRSPGSGRRADRSTAPGWRPRVVIRLATSLAEIGVRGPGFRSCRA